jgi:molybdopterin-guanine dinucleotide biosynthesis protein A
MGTIEGFILVGGASSRMGTDKARLLLKGETFVQRIAKATSAVTTQVTLVGRSAAELASDLPSAPDIYQNWGALGGLHTALALCRSEWALVVACDLPLVTAGLLAFLAGLRDDFEAVAPIQNDGRPQPLCALYRVDPCRYQTDQLIKTGERKPLALLQSVRTRWVSFGELKELPDAHRYFDNINTPQDYERASGKGDGHSAAG